MDCQREEQRRQWIALFDTLTLRDPVVGPAVVRPRVVALAAAPKPDEREHGAELRVGAKFGEEGATVHVVVRANAVERRNDAGFVLFGQKPAPQRHAIYARARRECELVGPIFK